MFAFYNRVAPSLTATPPRAAAGSARPHAHLAGGTYKAHQGELVAADEATRTANVEKASKAVLSAMLAAPDYMARVRNARRALQAQAHAGLSALTLSAMLPQGRAEAADIDAYLADLRTLRSRGVHATRDV